MRNKQIYGYGNGKSGDTGAISIRSVAFLTDILFENGISPFHCLTEDTPLDSNPESAWTGDIANVDINCFTSH